MLNHQQKQIEVINQIESQVKSNNLQASTVSPVEDFENDPRICLTSVHILSDFLKSKIKETIIEPLQKIYPDHFYYPAESIHMTIKNIRVINDPPHFSVEDIKKVRGIFSEIILNHLRFNVYFYRLLLFSNNLALMGTTDPELDNIILDLDKALLNAGIPDDKKYINSRYFFSNITLARFTKPVAQNFRHKINEISSQMTFDEPYNVDSVSLVTANAVFKKLQIIETWKLRER